MRSDERWESHVPTWAEATREQRVLLDAAWRAGELDFLLTPTQQEVTAKIDKWEKAEDLDDRIFAIDSSRRIGKSYILVSRGLSKAIKRQRSRLVYIAPEYEQVKKITSSIFPDLLRSCPPNLRPTWVKSELTWEFPNGSRIELVGLDKNPDSARGTGVDDILLDESGFFNDLEYVIYSVLYPQMLGRPWARIICASTPSESPMHYWSQTLVPKCISRDAHIRRTLDHGVQYTAAEREAFWAAMPGGRNGVKARREYGAEHIADETLAIIPEFAEAEKGMVRDVEPPVWRDCYVALDPGFHDMSAALFGYWNFLEQQLVIEDEIVAPKLNSAELARQIKVKEGKLWGSVRRRGPGFETRAQPYLRISDNDPRLLADLFLDHKLLFVATQKDSMVSQVDQVRVAIAQGKIVISPKCKKLVLHLKSGVWRKTPFHHQIAGKDQRQMFAREGGEMGHFDAIAALVYLWRNIHKHRNPTPNAERFVMDGVRAPAAANANGRPQASKWAQSGEKMRRDGQRFFVKTGRRIA